jgi:hypothetical protein
MNVNITALPIRDPAVGAAEKVGAPSYQPPIGWIGKQALLSLTL